MSDFEDPRQFFKCSRSDCEHDRAGNTPLCARHLREQEISAGATSISEPELEASLAHIRTEDDDHPGMVKVYDKETGEPSWVPAVPTPLPARMYVGPDPDTAYPEAVVAPTPPPPRPTTDTNTRSPVAGAHRTDGCWIAYHSDWSALALFNNELEALRHAVANTMSVGWAAWGQHLGGGRYPE